MKANELRDLVISAVLLAVAFGIALSGGFSPSLPDRSDLLKAILMALVGVSLGFVLHEMGHRFLARRFGCHAEYVMWPAGLIIALVGSLIGIVFAAPGAVVIYPQRDALGEIALTKERLGLISIAGPVMNISLALVFLVLYLAKPYLLFSLGAQVNSWLAVFNLIPLGPFDGAKILEWNKAAWGLVLVIGIGLFIFQMLYF
jgi:Zn-dependent protease